MPQSHLRAQEPVHDEDLVRVEGRSGAQSWLRILRSHGDEAIRIVQEPQQVRRLAAVILYYLILPSLTLYYRILPSLLFYAPPNSLLSLASYLVLGF